MPGVYNNRESGGSIEVLDEGVSLTERVTSLDFTGAGVTASASGNDVTVNTSGAAVSFAYDETPTGSINGSNKTFTLANTPNPSGSLILTLNGQTLTAGGVDYTLSTNTITMKFAPETNDILRAKFYQYS